jgi:lipopolysaccharide export system permease protein
MYRTLAHVPGGQPIGGLERFAGQIAASVTRLLPGMRSRAGAPASAAT